MNIIETGVEKLNQFASRWRGELAVGMLALGVFDAGVAATMNYDQPARTETPVYAIAPTPETILVTTTTAATTTTLPATTTTTEASTTTSPPEVVLEATAVAKTTPEADIFDFSFPQCDYLDLLPKDKSHIILGLNGGRPFTENRCLAQLGAMYEEYGVYVNTSYPGGDVAIPIEYTPVPCPVAVDPLYCKAYERGYVAGQYSVDLANRNGIKTRLWWIDVELANSWNGNVHEHRTYILAIADAIRFHADQYQIASPQEITVGLYSTVSMFDKVTRDRSAQKPEDEFFRPVGFPGWLATVLPEDQLLTYCGRSFTGDGTAMVQTQRDNVNGTGLKLDVNRLCPGVELAELVG